MYRGKVDRGEDDILGLKNGAKGDATALLRIMIILIVAHGHEIGWFVEEGQPATGRV